MTITTILFMFFIYCMIGWVWESTYESILNKKILNRGFLNGPYIPIYGFGGIAILLFLQRFQSENFWSLQTLKIYIIGAVGATLMEYITSYVLEKVLKARWWDYSNYPLNINGRICLIATIFWGIVAVLAINVINPGLMNFHNSLSHDTVLIFVTVMSTLFVVDIGITINSILDLKKRLSLLLALEKDKVTQAFTGSKEMLSKYRSKLSDLESPFVKRLIAAFPKLKFTSEPIQKVFDRVKSLKNKKEKTEESGKESE